MDGLPFMPPEWPADDADGRLFAALVASKAVPAPTFSAAPPRVPRANGPVTDFFPDGRRAAEWQYANGTRHGPAATWYPTGEPDSEGEWCEGLPHRLFFRWWPNGKLMVQGELDFGRAIGDWLVSDTEGATVFAGPWRSTLGSWLPRPYANVVTTPVPGRRR